MQVPPKTPEAVRFGVFEVDRRAGELRKGGVKIRLQDQPFQILLMLLERPGEVVTREDIQTRLWPGGTIVEFEHSIGTAIKKLRQALGDDAETPRYIETLPRRGFRFIAPINSPILVPPSARSRNWWRWPAAIAALAAAGIAAVVIYPRREPGSQPPRNLTRLTFDAGLQFGPTWSPDGRFIAYSSDRGGKFDIWVQQIGGLNPVRITNRPGHNWQPDWSADGNQIVFRSEGEGGGLFVVASLGGPERRISSFGHRPTWSPDGRLILFESTFVPYLWNKLYLVGVDGQPPREILTVFLERAQILWRSVAWYPNASRISIWSNSDQATSFWTVPLDGQNARKSEIAPKIAKQVLLASGWPPEFRWGPSAREIYFEGESRGLRNLWKVRVEPSTLRWNSLERLTTGPGPDQGLALSRDGKRLAFAARTERVRVWSYPFDPKLGRVVGQGQAVTPVGVDAWQPEISGDGKRLSYAVSRSGKWELWTKSLSDGTEALLSEEETAAVHPMWSPDGQHLSRQVLRPHSAPCFVTLHDGGGLEAITSDQFDGYCGDWSPDAQSIIVIRNPAVHSTHRDPGGPRATLSLMPLSAAPHAETKERLVTSSRSEWLDQARVSPNGRWIVFEAVKGGAARGGTATNATLQVVPAAGGEWIRITDGKFWDDKPRWSPDAKTIYFISARTGLFNVWGIRFDPDGGHPLGEPFQVTFFDSPALMVADDTSLMSMSVATNRLVLSMKETSGSIWALDDVDR